MRARLANHQSRDPVPVAWLTRLTNRAIRRLKIRQGGTLAVSFVDGVTMRRLNRRFTGHRHLTDVLSFRYDDARIAGEVIVAPAAARRYATPHGLDYTGELARYVVHGLLHWLGYDDRTLTQQHAMRKMEDALLATCGRERLTVNGVRDRSPYTVHRSR